MRDTADDVFDQVVFAVTNLLHGEHIGIYTVYQRVVAAALEHAGVRDVIRNAFKVVSIDTSEVQ